MRAASGEPFSQRLPYCMIVQPDEDSPLIDTLACRTPLLADFADLAQIDAAAASPAPEVHDELGQPTRVVLLDVMPAVLKDDVLELACGQN